MTSTDLEPTVDTSLAIADETSWFDVTMRQAHVLASSGLVPEQYRGKPDDIVVAAMFGRDLGWSPTMALQHVHVVKGKPALSAQSMLALVRGAGHSVQGDTSVAGATVTGTRADTGDSQTIAFGPEDQKRAGLSSEVWRKYPAAMFWARAVSQLCRTLFPDVLMGVKYTPDELRDIGPIDAPEIAAPPSSPDEPAPDDDAIKQLVAAKAARVAALGPEAEEHWTAWKATDVELNPEPEARWFKSRDGFLAASSALDDILQAFDAEPFDLDDSLVAEAGQDEGTDDTVPPTTTAVPSSPADPDLEIIDGELIEDGETF